MVRFCPRCKTHSEATKEMSLWRLPPVVVIHLKRFSYTNIIWRGKIDEMIDYPITYVLPPLALPPTIHLFLFPSLTLSPSICLPLPLMHFLLPPASFPSLTLFNSVHLFPSRTLPPSGRFPPKSHTFPVPLSHFLLPPTSPPISRILSFRPLLSLVLHFLLPPASPSLFHTFSFRLPLTPLSHFLISLAFLFPLTFSPFAFTL